MIHELKIWPGPFEERRIGATRTEVRDDGPAYGAQRFHAGDVLRLREWDPYKHDYTGRVLDVRVRWCLPLWETPGPWNIRANVTVMEIERLREHSNPRRHDPPASEDRRVRCPSCRGEATSALHVLELLRDELTSRACGTVGVLSGVLAELSAAVESVRVEITTAENG